MTKRAKSVKRNIDSYAHAGKDRANNPPVGLVTTDTDPDMGVKVYAHDPHIDPQLTWADKAEHTSFEVPKVSLHVHERIDPRTIIQAAVRKRQGTDVQMSLFEELEENPPLRKAIEFYKHRHNWTNRLIAGDSLLVMNSLMEKEGLGGKIQTIYIDPPYGIRYGSNFQPFVNKREVKDGKDEDLTSEPEQIRAFRDTWELGIHSYLTYLRDRLLLARELLDESGSCFVQIGDENVHHVRELMDEVFRKENFVTQIYFATNSGFYGATLSRVGDYIVWYARDRSNIKYRQLYLDKLRLESGDEAYKHIELADSSRRTMSQEERRGNSPLPSGAKIFRYGGLQGSGATISDTPFEFGGEVYRPNPNSHWQAQYPDGMDRLRFAQRVGRVGNTLNYIRYITDNPVNPLTNSWMDTSFAGFATNKKYVVETNPKVLQRCILMTTDPGDLVFDPTCGSGTMAYVAEQWGRRWITCDTSRVAITLAKQRLMTANFKYYELARPDEGVGGGFICRTFPHITLKSIANNLEIREGMSRAAIDSVIGRNALQETLHDQPKVDRFITRVTGPFTVEAVPSHTVTPIDELIDADPLPADDSVARSGPTVHQADWRDELLKTGIRGQSGQQISFARLEPQSGVRWLHATGETRPDDKSGRDTASNPESVVVSFGPDHAPLGKWQVEKAIQEAQSLVPRPKIIVFAAFQFDPESSKDIDETKWTGVTLLKAQMNADLLTSDLKKKRASNESFWLIGQPDIALHPIADGHDKGKFRICVQGFDYYNTKTGNIESGSADKIALWMLDPDYDGRSLFARQVFFPMAGAKDGWAKLAHNLKAEIDPDLIEAYRGTESLPFEAGEHNRAAVKIVDDRGIESLKIVELE